MADEGAEPGDLAIAVTTSVTLSINLKTARELGLEIPANILALADLVIE